MFFKSGGKQSVAKDIKDKLTFWHADFKEMKRNVHSLGSQIEDLIVQEVKEFLDNMPASEIKEHLNLAKEVTLIKRKHGELTDLTNILD